MSTLELLCINYINEIRRVGYVTYYTSWKAELEAVGMHTGEQKREYVTSILEAALLSREAELIGCLYEEDGVFEDE